MPACSRDLGALIQGCFWVGPVDGEFLCEAEVAALLTAFVWEGPGMDTPGDVVCCPFLLEIPDVRRQFGAALLLWMAEVVVVAVKPLLERWFAQPIVLVVAHRF